MYSIDKVSIRDLLAFSLSCIVEQINSLYGKICTQKSSWNVYKRRNYWCFESEVSWFDSNKQYFDNKWISFSIMFKLLVITIALQIACSSAFKIQPKIIKGYTTNPEDVPFYVFFYADRNESSTSCGGSLISDG